MNKEQGNIFRIAREEAGLTQEVATGLLLISDRSMLSRYERDVVRPDDETVFRMMKVYNAEWLGYEYIRIYFKVGRAILPELTRTGLGQLTTRAYKDCRDVSEVKDDLIDIGYDGEITPDEEPIWRSSTQELTDAIGTFFSLIFYRTKISPSQDGYLGRADKLNKFTK